MAIEAASMTNLDTYYQQLIETQMAMESKPLNTLNTQVDDLKIQNAMYEDLGSKFDDLQDAIKALLSTDAFYEMTPGRSATVNTDADQTVLTATASSSAIVGSYEIDITQTATGQKVRSDKQSYSDQNLNLLGSFVVGGSETRSISNVVTDSTVSSIDLNGTIVEDQDELGTSTYYVETRQNEDGDWQFRLVNENGEAMSIRNNALDNDSFTTNWQDIPVGDVYETGRGLDITFGTDSELYTALYRTDGASSVDYSAQGAIIEVTESDSLEDIAANINAANYAEGNEISATIVDNMIIIQTANTGATKLVSAADISGGVLESLGVVNSSGDYVNYSEAEDGPRDAMFTVNGLDVVRSSNTDISNVIAGVSFDLEPDAEGLSATIKVTADSSDSYEAVNTFVQKFNTLAKYVQTKIATVKDEETETYTRGALASDITFRLFNSDMYSTLNRKYDNGGEYSYLYEIGLEFNDDNELEIADQTLLNSVLKYNFDDVELFLEELMGTLNSKVGVFTGSTGYIETALDSTENQQTFYESRVSSMEERLTLRRTQLINQYTEMQLEIEALTLTQSTLAAGYSYLNTSS